MFDFTSIKRVAASLVGAGVLSATCVLGAVGPARASVPAVATSSAAWQAQVGHQLDSSLRMPSTGLDGRAYAVATVTARFDADGNFTGAELGRTSGLAAVDREALRAVSHIAFPRLPVAMIGTRAVPVMVYLGEGDAGDHEARIGRLAAQVRAG